MTTAANCTARHGKPTTAADGLQLCEHHTRDLTDDIRAIGPIHNELLTVLTRRDADPDDDGSGKPSKSTTVGISLNDAALKAREHIRVELVSWCRIALEEGPWDHAPANTTTAMSAWLVKRATWLASRPYADEAARTFEDTHREAKAALQPDIAKRIEIGACPSRLTDDEGQDAGPCDGSLFAIIRYADSLLPSFVGCTSDYQHRWKADEWRHLGRLLKGHAHADLARRLAG